MTTRENFIEATAKAAAEQLPHASTILACGVTALGQQVAIIFGRDHPQLPPKYIAVTANAALEDDHILVEPADLYRDHVELAPRDSPHVYTVRHYDRPVINYEDAGIIPVGSLAHY